MRNSMPLVNLTIMYYFPLELPVPYSSGVGVGSPIPAVSDSTGDFPPSSPAGLALTNEGIPVNSSSVLRAVSGIRNDVKIPTNLTKLAY